MSVLARDRRLSKLESYKNASDLVAHTFRYADFKHFSKSDKDIVWKLRELAMEVLTNTIKGLDTYPNCEMAVELRKEFFLRALASNNALDGLLSTLLACIFVKDAKVILVKGISDYGWLQWGELNAQQNKLLKGLLEADKKLTFNS